MLHFTSAFLPVTHLLTFVSTSASLPLCSSLQPVAVSVDANGGAWQFYTSGVLTSHCGKQLDHAVLATGYGTDSSGQDYYTVSQSQSQSLSPSPSQSQSVANATPPVLHALLHSHSGSNPLPTRHRIAPHPWPLHCRSRTRGARTGA